MLSFSWPWLGTKFNLAVNLLVEGANCSTSSKWQFHFFGVKFTTEGWNSRGSDMKFTTQFSRSLSTRDPKSPSWISHARGDHLSPWVGTSVVDSSLTDQLKWSDAKADYCRGPVWNRGFWTHIVFHLAACCGRPKVSHSWEQKQLNKHIAQPSTIICYHMIWHEVEQISK